MSNWVLRAAYIFYKVPLDLEETTMAKQSKRIILLLSGLCLWTFFVFQEEMANYGIYTLVTYSLHEAASLIPYLSIGLTTAWAVSLFIRIAKKKVDQSDQIFAAVLLALLILQGCYLHHVSNICTTTGLVTVESVSEQQGEIVVVGVDGYASAGHRIVLKTPMLAYHLMETDGQIYFITYGHHKNNPTEGILYMVW